MSSSRTLADVTGESDAAAGALEREEFDLDPCEFELFTMCRVSSVQQKEAGEAASFARSLGGRQEARTPDLRVANEQCTTPDPIEPSGGKGHDPRK